MVFHGSPEHPADLCRLTSEFGILAGVGKCRDELDRRESGELVPNHGVFRTTAGPGRMGLLPLAGPLRLLEVTEITCTYGGYWDTSGRHEDGPGRRGKRGCCYHLVPDNGYCPPDTPERNQLKREFDGAFCLIRRMHRVVRRSTAAEQASRPRGTSDATPVRYEAQAA